MTNMRRVTISLPDDLDRRILELRKDERFIRCSYSDIVRQMLEHGLSVTQEGGLFAADSDRDST